MRFVIYRGNKFETIETQNPFIKNIDSFREIMHLSPEIPVFQTNKTPVQLIADKDIELDKGMKLEGDKVVPMSETEKLDVGIMTIDEYNELQKQRRASAFSNEADPLYFKVQRGEATKAEYITLVKQIREKYPYKE